MKKQTIKEVKEKLLETTEANDPYIQELLKDDRKGVQTALKQWQKQQDAKQELKDRFVQRSAFEQQAADLGYQWIAGIDEVGRGPLAGPVVSAAVILDPKKPILGLDDSKKLSLAKRMQLFNEIHEQAIAVGVGIVDSDEIDRINILQATKKAMNLAVANLPTPADFLLVDAVKLDTPIPQETIIKGDLNSNSIAAASIIAKVKRDEMMEQYDEVYPGYGFGSNMGYGTKEHLNGLEALGVTPIHRHSFAPVRNNLK